MESAFESSLGIVAYLALFAGVGLAFVFVNLLIGRFVRPDNPSVEKKEIYECGEPAIGSSFVQFDLRFYVVALVFIIFDVEVAFLFPWATVFGKTTSLVNEQVALVEVVDGQSQLTPVAAGVYRELGEAVTSAGTSVAQTETALRDGIGSYAAGSLEFAGLRQIVALAALAALVFFVVLLVGFAYEWRTGALDWVRAMTKVKPTAPQPRVHSIRERRQESVLTA